MVLRPRAPSGMCSVAPSTHGPVLLGHCCLHIPGASGHEGKEGTLGLNQALDLPRGHDNTHVTWAPPQRDPGQCWPHGISAPRPPFLPLLQPFFLLKSKMQRPHF